MLEYDNRKSVQSIFLRENLNDGMPCIYTFGWFTLEKDDKKAAFHAGQLGGFTNIMIKLREYNFSIIILTNYFRDSFQKIFKSNFR